MGERGGVRGDEVGAELDEVADEARAARAALQPEEQRRVGRHRLLPRWLRGPGTGRGSGAWGGSMSGSGCRMSPRASHRLLPRRRSRSSAGRAPRRSSTPPRARCSTKCRSVCESPTLLVGRQRVENFDPPRPKFSPAAPQEAKKCLLGRQTAGDALRVCFLAETTREQKADFITSMETARPNFTW